MECNEDSRNTLSQSKITESKQPPMTHLCVNRSIDAASIVRLTDIWLAHIDVDRSCKLALPFRTRRLEKQTESRVVVFAVQWH